MRKLPSLILAVLKGLTDLLTNIVLPQGCRKQTNQRGAHGTDDVRGADACYCCELELMALEELLVILELRFHVLLVEILHIVAHVSDELFAAREVRLVRFR